MTMNAPTHARLLLFGKFLLILLFAISLPQRPLYSSNQNTYFVHGLADAGVGHLNLDWLAQTTDPFPVFSALVSITVRFFGENAFYIYQILIQAIYAYSLLGIGSYVFRLATFGLRYLSYCALLCALYSGLLGRVISQLPVLWRLAYVLSPGGPLTSGVAGQYILGPFFQPSVFGVYILLSIYAYLRDRLFVAILCLAIATTFHPTYLLSAAVLTCTYMVVLVCNDKAYRKALLLGATAFLLVIPIITYSYVRFKPTSADIYAQAQGILMYYRIPHHAVVKSWYSRRTLFKIIMVALSICLVRRTKALPVLVVSFLAAMILTAAQLLTGSRTLALLFPWRISVFLVPIASGTIIASIVSATFPMLRRVFHKRRLEQRPIRLAFLVGGMTIAVVVLVSDFMGGGDHLGFGMKQLVSIIVGSGVLTASLTARHWSAVSRVLVETRLMRLARAASLGLVILLGLLGVRRTITLLNTPRINNTAFTRFIASTYQSGNLYLIPPNLEWFRLAARVPIFVDFKSHPYKDTELIEWFKRIELANDFYASSGDTACSLLQHMSEKYGITHVIGVSSITNCGMLHESYKDTDLVIYEVQSRQ